MKPLQAILGRTHQLLGQTQLGLAAAVKLRNQCEAVIGRAHGSAVPDSASNGEQAFLARLASAIRFFVDAGANKGDWTAMLLALHPEAEGLLFDPSSSALKILRARFAAAQNVEIVPAGVGDAPGALSFYEEEAAG